MEKGTDWVQWDWWEVRVVGIAGDVPARPLWVVAACHFDVASWVGASGEERSGMVERDEKGSRKDEGASGQTLYMFTMTRYGRKMGEVTGCRGERLEVKGRRRASGG